MRLVENAFFLPYRPDSSWGVFDSSHQIVIEGVDLRGSSRTPHQRCLDWPTWGDLIGDTAKETYLYCGWMNPHYGHFLINSLPRFWPFFGKNPNLKILLASPLGGLPGYIQNILSRLGVNASSVISFDQPTGLKNVAVPTSSVLEQYWIYTIYRDLCEQISRDMWDENEVDSIETPVYLSKSRLASGVGKISNETIIEDIMTSSGIDIVYPENLSFAEQVRLFARRKLIIGPTGSAFHTALFAPQNRNIICFNPAKEINSNFALIDKVCMTNSDYYYQRGMTYGSSKDFITIVHPADASQLGRDLVTLARRRASW